MNSLLLSMPGSPILYYGDEIGMGDNVFIGDRNGVRTPMQWSRIATPDSRAPIRSGCTCRRSWIRLWLPGDQCRSADTRPRLIVELDQTHAGGTQDQPGIRARRAAVPQARQPEDPRVPARICDDAILCVANLSRSAQPVELNLAPFKGRVPVEMLGRTTFPPIGDMPYLLTLAGYGFYWFRLTVDAEAPSWHEQIFSIDERPVVVLFDGWSTLFRDRVMPWRIGMAEKTRLQFEDGYVAALY